jgi:hypothetical protein
MSLIQEGGTTNAFDISPQPIVPGAIGVTNKVEGETGGRLTVKDAQLLVNDGANDRVLVGQRADGSYGIDVSKTGFDISSGASNLVMSSSFNMFKIVATGTSTVIVTAGYVNGDSFYSSTINFAALGLTASPAVLAYFTPAIAGYSDGLMVPHVRTAGTSIGYSVRYLVFPTTLTFEVNMGVLVGAQGDYIFRYYILQETAQ